MTTLDRKPWPLHGYAPGNYTCRCHTCDKQFVGDKRATTCLECAVIEAKDALSSLPAQGGNGFLTDGPADPDQYAAYVAQELKRPLAERLRLITHVGPYHLRNTPNEAADALSPPGQPAAVGVTDQFRQLRGAIERITQEISVTAREQRDGNTPDEFSKGWDAALDQVESLVRNHSPHGLEAHRLVDALEAALRSTP